MTDYRFTWATANPVERANWIRQSYQSLGERGTRKIFLLSEAGLSAILDGAAWRSDYEISETNSADAA